MYVFTAYMHVYVLLFYHRLVSSQQLTFHSNNDIATRVGVLPTQTTCIIRVIHACDTRKFSVPHVPYPLQYATVELHHGLQPNDTWLLVGLEHHCRPNSIVTQNWVSLEFGCHPKSSVAGFQECDVMHWHSNSTVDTWTISHILVPPNVKVYFDSSIK